MDAKHLYERFKDVEAICHVKAQGPEYPPESMGDCSLAIEFLDGPFKGLMANVEAYNLREE